MRYIKLFTDIVRFVLISISSLVLSGCSGTVSKSDRGEIKKIKDMRDGEIIVFNTDNVRNMRYNPLTGDYSFTFVSTNGVEMTMTKALEPYFKEM